MWLPRWPPQTAAARNAPDCVVVRYVHMADGIQDSATRMGKGAADLQVSLQQIPNGSALTKYNTVSCILLRIFRDIQVLPNLTHG